MLFLENLGTIKKKLSNGIESQGQGEWEGVCFRENGGGNVLWDLKESRVVWEEGIHRGHSQAEGFEVEIASAFEEQENPCGMIRM